MRILRAGLQRLSIGRDAVPHQRLLQFLLGIGPLPSMIGQFCGLGDSAMLNGMADMGSASRCVPRPA
jgi:hypothetical protein